MGKIEKTDMTEYDDLAGITAILATYGYLRWPLQRIGVPGLKSLTIFAEEGEALDFYLTALTRSVPARKLQNLNSRQMAIKNFELGIHVYTRREKETELHNFWSREDFLPVLGVSGLVPQFALEETYVLRIDQTELERCNWLLFAERMAPIYRYFRENIGGVLEEAQRYLDFENFNEGTGFTAIFGLAEHLFLTGLVHSGEKNVKSMKHKLRRIIAGQKKFQNIWADIDGMAEIVCWSMHQFVQKAKSVFVVEIRQIEGKAWEALEEGRAILFDWDFYYISSELFAEICENLLKIISMPKLKESLQMEGILVCNDIVSRNFTVKKVIYNAMGQAKRYRFLKFRKDDLLDENGLGLEDVWKEEFACI